jgi:hypothetical protein
MVRLKNLSQGESTSCGCINRSSNGYSNNPLTKKFYQVVDNAYTRCYNPKSKKYARYGGRGIQVKFASKVEFADYIQELPGWSPEMSLDRIDNDGNYEKGNLRWATQQQQIVNRGIHRTNTSGVKYLSRRTT